MIPQVVHKFKVILVNKVTVALNVLQLSHYSNEKSQIQRFSDSQLPSSTRFVNLKIMGLIEVICI